MLVVFDKYTENTKKFQETMNCLEIDVKVAVLEDDGFLPCGTLSPYEYFVYEHAHDFFEKKELFYDFLEVPEFWEIRSLDMHGAVYDMGCKKAEIYFTDPIEKKNVQRVEWCMENGWVYKIDYYNKYALKYASEFLDMDGNVESKVFYSAGNQEVIVEQPQNDTVVLLEGGETRAFFTSYNEFIEYYMKEISLGESCALFMQDDDGFRFLNFKSGVENIWKYVLFSKNELLDKYVGMDGKNGYRFYNIPEEYPANNANGEALILTSVDLLEGIEYLIHELPEMIFHIGASTQVSDKLFKLGELENVKVYPQISMRNLDALWNQCDFYLDINHYWESYNAIDVAHQKNLLIMGFEHTLHHQELVTEDCIFSKGDTEGLALTLKKLINHMELVQEHLVKQQGKRREVLRTLFI